MLKFSLEDLVTYSAKFGIFTIVVADGGYSSESNKYSIMLKSKYDHWNPEDPDDDSGKYIIENVTEDELELWHAAN